MRDEWIAVARGLNCLSISIQASFFTFWFALIGLFFFVLLAVMGPGGIALPPWVALVPAGIAAVVAIVCSRLARVFLMKVPRHVPAAARFSATASFVLGLISQTGWGALFAASVFNIHIAIEIKFVWVGTTLVAGIVAWLHLQLVLSKIAALTQGVDLGEYLSGTLALLGFGGVLCGLGCVVAYHANHSANVIIALLLFLAALIVLGFAFTLYLKDVRSLRYSVLWKAARCEDDAEYRD